MTSNVIDGRYKHPFTCIVAGPSGAGKSTFVHNLMLKQNILIDVIFDYVVIFLGTDAKQNETLSSLKTKLNPQNVIIYEINKLFPNDELFKKNFQPFFESLIFEDFKDQKGCVIFDDLMSELSHTNVLVNLFSKYSSHGNISSINITQNIFFKSSKISDNTTIYRNTHILVLFKNPLDNTIVYTIAKRIKGTNKFKSLVDMLNDIMDKNRYVVIQGNFKTPDQLRFTSDIFTDFPFQYQRVFALT
jgi:adenylate kinase family enzyme